MKKDIKKLIELIWSDATDDEVVNEVISFLQSEDVNNGYKVDLLATLAERANHNYYVDKMREFDERNSQ
ncbi:hypothetical protein [Bacillus cytotoxicus]|uniref:hypothetical protein n=2 Tax=Bacillus TaxID=1386 RepID=UPI000863E6DD|nr:hypothetical protein [Bacillus cytotoxicus]AWC29270.1 hypothetical protein CG483_013675 [Bacillus cytotoxicus]AWC41396.1 hypothetical protein CG480_013675 [Bacillus cytotoxicus]AWC49327.1 hypothetical protein CG478_013675 [Bacillus cytotoxicus]AWC53342.1 hypothetical protein CG477_013635 [Bacillus cytotoxicus]AWC57469.1 hypothetical protein CG476_013660 [Bacillus cytotoxicus]